MVNIIRPGLYFIGNIQIYNFVSNSTQNLGLIK